MEFETFPNPFDIEQAFVKAVSICQLLLYVILANFCYICCTIYKKGVSLKSRKATLEFIDLPEDVIECILKQDILTIKDVVNFKSTCIDFFTMKFTEKFYENKFLTSWPMLKDDVEECKRNNQTINWVEEYKQSFIYKKTLIQTLNIAIEQPKREFAESNVLLSTNFATPRLYVAIFELQSFLDNPRNKHLLEQCYYAHRNLLYLKQSLLSKKWNDKSMADQTVEQVALFVTDWCQTKQFVSKLQISSDLESIASESMEVLKKKNPNHSLFSLEAWKLENVRKSIFNAAESVEILDCLSETMFDHLNFTNGRKDVRFILSRAGHYCLNQILKTKCSSPLMLAVVFASVAQRLGVVCELTYSPEKRGIYSLIRWQYYNPLMEQEEYSYYVKIVDLMYSETLLTRKEFLWDAGLVQNYHQKYQGLEQFTTTKLVEWIVEDFFLCSDRLPLGDFEKRAEQQLMAELNATTNPNQIIINQEFFKLSSILDDDYRMLCRCAMNENLDIDYLIRLRERSF